MLLSLQNKTFCMFLGGRQLHVETHLPQVRCQCRALLLCRIQHPFLVLHCSLAGGEQAARIAAQEFPAFL